MNGEDFRDWPWRYPRIRQRPATGWWSRTELCYEWSLQVPDTGTESYERHVMLGAMSLCRGAGAPESYTAFRQLLIEHPVLTRRGGG